MKYSNAIPEITVSVEDRGGAVAIAVRDRGIGVPAAELRSVFERFVRGAEATRLGVKGTGLGLALVSHIVTAHGGSTELESEVGAGSTFTIKLPSARTTAASGSESTISAEAPV